MPYTDEEIEQVRAFQHLVQDRYKDTGPPFQKDSVLLAFMLANRVEFLERDDSVLARTFMNEWTPYGKGRTKHEALTALVVNAVDPELKEGYLNLPRPRL